MRSVVLFTLLIFAQAGLVANYKLYDSLGGTLYDYSGNGRHGEVWWSLPDTNKPVLTDRGTYFYGPSSINLASNGYKDFPGGPTVLLSFWTCIRQSGTLLRFTLPRTTGWHDFMRIIWEINGSIVRFLYNINSAPTSTISDTTIPSAQVSSNIQVKVYNGPTNIASSSYTFTNLSLTNSFFMIGIKYGLDLNLEGLFYEIWWRDDIITDISTTISAIQGSIPYVFTTPPELDPYKTYLGMSCDVSCSSKFRSCAGSSTNCIHGWNFGVGKNGFYNLAAPIYLSTSALRCSSYDYSTNKCSGCVSNLILSNNSCGCSSDKKLQRHYTTFKCMNIISNCKTYHFHEGCGICDDNYYVFCSNMNCLISEKVCVLNCPTGYYKDDTSIATCRACETNCGTCTNSTTCTGCINNTYLKVADCVISCGAGYYQDIISKRCIQCSANCSSCSNTGCNTCINNTYLLSGICVDSCGIGYYQNSINKSCTQCSSNCDICDYISSDLICTTCASSYYKKAGVCLLDCGSRYYKNTVAMSCDQCPAHCRECISLEICTDCDSGYALTPGGGSILCNSCPAGKYASNSACFTCPNACTTCTSITNCTGCISNASISSLNGICYCNLGYHYSSGTCIQAFTAAGTMSLDGTIDLIFSANLNTDVNTSLLTFKDGSLAYDSSTFSITTFTAYRRYTITLNKILLTGLNIMRLYFPSGSAILKSSADLELATEYIDIFITSSSIIYSCSGVSNCLSCSKSGTSFICDSCRDSDCLYSYPDIRCGVCCDAGYYHEVVNSIDYCIKCANKCYTCTDSSSCSSCDGLYYLLIDDCILECGLGRYKNQSNNQCFDCISNCDECSDSISCMICKSGYIYNSLTYECEPCPIGKYYSSGICEECPTLCKACLSDTECVECIDNGYLNHGICECQIGYFNDIINSSCMSCNIQNCAYCEYNFEYNSPVCLECTDETVLTKEGCIKCSEATYYIYGDCIECPELCVECSNIISCIRCKEHAEMILEECKCKLGYVKYMNECVKSIEISLTYIEDGKYKLSFSQPLSSELSYESIIISISNHTYSSEEFKFQKLQGSSNEEYIITINNLDPSQVNNISISFTSQVLIPGIDTLSSYSLNITSQYQSNNTSSSQSFNSQEDYLAQDPSAQELASLGSALTMYTSTAAAAMSFSSIAELWSFINTIQLLSLIPFLNVDLPTMLFATLVSTRSYNPIPNLIIYIIPEKGPRPFRRASLLGYETGQFLVNIGDIVTALFITIGTLPILIIINRVLPQSYQQKYVGKKVSQLIQDYKWNAFTRFYIEGYIEFAIAALIQIFTMNYLSDSNDLNLMINLMFAGLIMISIVIFPVILGVFIYRNYPRISDEVFMNRWGSIFEELDNSKGLSCSFYYVYFLSSRLGIVACFFLLKDRPITQIISTSIICWIKFYIVARFRPFKEKLRNTINTIVEGCTACCYSLVLPYAFNIGDRAKDIVQWSIIGLMILSFAISLSVMIYNTTLSIIQFIRCKCVKREGKVYPEEGFSKGTSVLRDSTVSHFSTKMEESFFSKLRRRKSSELYVT